MRQFALNSPKDTSERVSDMFRQPLVELLNPRHELVSLAGVMDWGLIEATFSKHFARTTGRPALSPRLVAGLLHVQHAYVCSDEGPVNTWVENPYWQAVAHPTDGRLLEISRQHLVALAKEDGLTLRRNDNREAPRLASQIGRYAHAKQYRRMKKSLRSRAGQMMRDVVRQLKGVDPRRQNRDREILGRVNRILTQQTKDKNTLHAFHVPEVECISTGRARTPDEFGVKVTVATTLEGASW